MMIIAIISLSSNLSKTRSRSFPQLPILKGGRASAQPSIIIEVLVVMLIIVIVILIIIVVVSSREAGQAHSGAEESADVRDATSRLTFRQTSLRAVENCRTTLIPGSISILKKETVENCRFFLRYIPGSRNCSPAPDLKFLELISPGALSGGVFFFHRRRYYHRILSLILLLSFTTAVEKEAINNRCISLPKLDAQPPPGGMDIIHASI